MFKRDGSRYWYTRIGGVPVSLRTEVQVDAEALEGKLKQQHWQETYLGVKPRKTWEQACVQWGKENGGKITWKDDVRAIRFWTEHFGNLRDIREITRESVDEICQAEFEITKEASPQNNTANHYIAYLSAILRAASRKWAWIETSPLLRRYPTPDGRKRWLSVGEWQTLESVISAGHLRLAAKFALATGLRRGALVALQWSAVDIAGRSLTFVGSSNKLGNTIPLNDTAMSVLEEIQASPVRHMQLVFTKNGKALGHYQKEWYRALDACGLRGGNGEDFCWHGLRHTWASWLAQAGVPEWARKRLGGWSSGQMVDRYTHLDLEALRPYAAVIDTVLSQSTDKVKVSVGSGTRT